MNAFHAVLSVTLFEKVPILQALQASDFGDNGLDDSKRLILFDFKPDSSGIIPELAMASNFLPLSARTS